MEQIKLILPNSNQQNWGNAINGNLTTIYEKYKQIITQIQALYKQIDILDIVHTSNTEFVYINKEQNAFIVTPGYGRTMSNSWSSVENSILADDIITPFNPSNKNNLDAFFVMTEEDQTIKWENLDWTTGDLLIVHKNTGSDLSVEGAETTVEQWKNMMGGFYEPISSTMQADGTQITSYKKHPNVASESTINLNTSHLFYKPTKYTSGTQNRLTFTPYSMIGNQETELTIPEVELVLPTDVYAKTNVIEINSFEPDQLITFTFNNVVINNLGDINISFVVFYNTVVDGTNQETGEFINFPYRCVYEETGLVLKIITNVGYFTLPTTGSYKIQCIMTTYVNPTLN